MTISSVAFVSNYNTNTFTKLHLLCDQVLKMFWVQALSAIICNTVKNKELVRLTVSEGIPNKSI